MSDFWHLAKQLLRYPMTLVMSVVLAALAATGLGVGLAAMIPTLKMLMSGSDPVSLVDLANRFNAEGHAIAIPPGLIARLPDDPYRGLVLIIVALCIGSVFGCAVTFLHRYLSLALTTKTVTLIRQQAFRQVVWMPLSRVVERGPSEFVAKVVRDTAELQRGFLAITNKSVIHVSRGLVCFAVALLASWEVAIIAPFSAILFGAVLKKFGKRIKRASRGSLEAQERMLHIATETLQGLRAVKVNTAEGHANWRFHVENKRLLREELRAHTARALASPVMELLTTLMVAFLALLFARQIIRGGLPFEEFVVALAALGLAAGSMKPLTSIVNELQAASAPATRLRSIFNEPRETAPGRRRPRLSRHHRDIVLDNVSFRYPAANRPAIDGVSLRIEHGQRVAIVGPNGSGKTTLVSLLPRLMVPTAGRILIDGVDIESVSLSSLRRQIGVVTQETVLFRGTVFENIALGGVGVNRDQVVDAAKRSHAHQFIMELEDGYEADIAEQGASLSGGQRQRLAIARAVISDPSILILDEATSQIDAESEHHIGQALDDFCQNRTVITIAHRLSTVRNADRIVVMDEGKVVDHGPHDRLLSTCELYERLSRTQLTGA